MGTERPLYSRCDCIRDLGRTSQLSQVQKKEMAGERSIKSTEHLDAGMQFMEGAGLGLVLGGRSGVCEIWTDDEAA